MNINQEVNIGLVSISDRASSGKYEDKGIPHLKEWLNNALITKFNIHEILIPDEEELIKEKLIDLVDNLNCALVLTTGGTGPAIRDVTPDATIQVADRILDGFGEQMRSISLQYVPTAILSRQVAVIRKSSLIINLPGQPKAISQTLDEIFKAVPYCIDLIGGPYLETNSEVIQAFRPKNK